MTQKSDPRQTRDNVVDPDSSLLTPAQVATMLGISEATLTGWRSRGRYNLKYVKVGSRVMYRRESVSDFVRNQERDASAPE